MTDHVYRRLGEMLLRPACTHADFPTHPRAIPRNAHKTGKIASDSAKALAWFVHELGQEAQVSSGVEHLREWSLARAVLQSILAHEAQVPDDALVFHYLLDAEGNIYADYHSGNDRR